MIKFAITTEWGDERHVHGLITYYKECINSKTNADCSKIIDTDDFGLQCDENTLYVDFKNNRLTISISHYNSYGYVDSSENLYSKYFEKEPTQKQKLNRVRQFLAMIAKRNAKKYF